MGPGHQTSCSVLWVCNGLMHTRAAACRCCAALATLQPAHSCQSARPSANPRVSLPAGVAEELLWFVSGCTNAKALQDKVRPGAVQFGQPANTLPRFLRLCVLWPSAAPALFLFVLHTVRLIPPSGLSQGVHTWDVNGSMMHLEPLASPLNFEPSASFLPPQGIHIWDGNGSREYLDSIGLTHR